MEGRRGITFGQAFVLILIAGGIFILASMFLDSYREEHAKQEISAALSSPEVMNAQLSAVQDETKYLCMTKGYSAEKCDEILSSPLGPDQTRRSSASASSQLNKSSNNVRTWPSAKGRSLSAADSNGCIKELAEEAGSHC